MSRFQALIPLSGSANGDQVRVRVRTGCFTCKKRRIKCDEKRPACLRCTHTGRTCDGYSIDRHPSLLTTSFYSLPFRIPGSQHDRQVFHYYYNCAAADMCGFLPESSDFWGRVVLETSFHQPVVREMLIALASIHRDYATFDPGNGVSEGPSNAALGQYNKALRRFRGYVSQSSNPDKMHMIICCILFHCFESVRGESGWAARHLETALQVLEACQPGILEGAAPLDHATNGTLDTLRATLIRLDLQLSSFSDSRVPSFSLAPEDVKTGKRNCTDEKFSSLAEAQRTLETLQNWLLRFIIINAPNKFVPLDAQAPSVLQELHTLRTQLARWDAAFEEFRHQQPAKDIERKKCFSAMQLKCRLCTAMCFSYPHAAHLETFSDHLHCLIDNISALLAFDIAVGEALPRKVSCDMEVVMPLFLLAVKSRSPSLRARALGMLAGLKRQEGMMSASMMAQIVVGVMELEHEGWRFPIGDPMGEETPSVEEWASGLINTSGDYHDLAAMLDNVRFECKGMPELLKSA